MRRSVSVSRRRRFCFCSQKSTRISGKDHPKALCRIHLRRKQDRSCLPAVVSKDRDRPTNLFLPVRRRSFTTRATRDCNSRTARSNRCGAFVIRRRRRGGGVTPPLAHRSVSLTPAKKSSSFQFPANNSTKQNHENKTHHYHRSHRFPVDRGICANATLTPSLPFPARFASTAQCSGTAGSP